MKRLFANLGFKIHLAVYAGVNLLLAIVNLLTTPGTLWFFWPLIGWGLGVIGHGAAVYYASGRPVTREQVVRAKLAARG